MAHPPPSPFDVRQLLARRRKAAIGDDWRLTRSCHVSVKGKNKKKERKNALRRKNQLLLSQVARETTLVIGYLSLRRHR